jgi:hypothetical protein
LELITNLIEASYERYDEVVRLTLSLVFISACYSQDFQTASIRDAFKKTDPSLDWFRVVEKKPIDAATSVMLVTAAPVELRSGRRWPVNPLMKLGVFVVSGPDNQVRLTLDTISGHDNIATLDQLTEHSVTLHMIGDYGMYRGSIKYGYDLSARTPVSKTRFGVLALTSSTVSNGRLIYAASFGPDGENPAIWKQRHATVTIHPDALPRFDIVEAPDNPKGYNAPVPLPAGNGESVIVERETPPGKQHQASRIYVVSKTGAKQSFSPPVPSMDFYRRTLPSKNPQLELESDIGPFVLRDNKIWFASTFYDGEGTSGVGAIGDFDIASRKYRMRYLPEIAGWSGSAILLDGDELWIGRVCHPEGSDMGGGLLRYNINTGSVKAYSFTDVVHTIDRLGDAIYCGSSNGLYRIRDGKLTHFRFEPDAKGKLTMIAGGA